MKHMTLMIVPYQGAEVRSLKIRHSALKLMAMLVAIVFCSLVGTAIYLRPVIEKAREYDRLNAQNQLLSLEKQKIRELNNKIAALEKLVAKIHLAQGVGEHQAVDEAIQRQKEKEATQEEFEIPLEGGKSFSASVGSDRRDSRTPFGAPVDEKGYISRSYNEEIYHFGIDIALKKGTPIRATADGTVSVAEKSDDLGYYVMIKHASGYSTLYAHNSSLAVESGTRVRRGDLIAHSGNLGQSSGPHLHYAILDKDGNPVDPMPFLEP
jgi:murein DD-endopeptidase MepM/ murein hydrolase activator NlpD